MAREPDDAAVATARVYAWNTVGAIAGALGAGFVLLPSLGFHGTLNVGVATNLALAVVAALAASPRRWVTAGLAAAAGLVLLLAPARPPWTLLTSSPMKSQAYAGRVVYSAVGRTGTVMLYEQGWRYQITSDGLPEARIDSIGMLAEINVAHWLAALPALLRPDARDLLVVGLGGGVALELVPSTFSSIDVIEIEPEMLTANRKIAESRARDPLADPRIRVHIGDARGTLQLVDRRYDAIVSQPSHPWTAGASHLYTREFFTLVRSRLASEGVFVQWIGINFVDEALVQSLLAALLEVFPHVEVFRPQLHGLLFAASMTPIDTLAGTERALRVAPDAFAQLGLHRVEDVASAWALDEQGVRSLAAGAPSNTDDHNLLATRSGRLGEAKLTTESTRALLGPYDPLVDGSELDSSALIRGLLARGQSERAIDLAIASGGAREESGLGWVELAKAGRSGRARRHFERALSLSPGYPDALAGLIASQKLELTEGRATAALRYADLETRHTALIQGWRLADSGNWSAVAELDAELDRIEVGEPLFEMATRLRITWRLNTRDPVAALEALSLADILLLRSWSPSDELLRARAAIGADLPLAARASLLRVAQRSTTNPRGRALAGRALEIAQDLQGEQFDGLRLELEQRVRGSRPAPVAGSDEPAQQGMTRQ
jgi:hypothetical protein